jgi:hypothetical protein
MKATIQLELKPFQVPNFVLGQVSASEEFAGMEPLSFPLTALDPEILERMCSDFKKSVFSKAKKVPPPQCS